jgi:membrane peptidoglycan carboxypeptidase
MVALSLFMGLLGRLVAAIWLGRTDRTVMLDQR